MKLNIQRFALSINVSGSLKIQIQPLENKKADLEKEKNKVEDFINKISADLKKAIESADAETKENLEKYKAEFEKQKDNIREMISDTQKKIDSFIQAVVKKHTAVQTRFGQILVEYGNKLKAEADGTVAATAATPTTSSATNAPAAAEPAAPAAETPVAQPTPATPANPFNQINNKLNETKSILRQKIDQLSNTIKTNNNAFKEKITSGNAFGSIKNLFDNTNSAINNLFKRR